MSSDLEKKAKEAFIDESFELAAELLTQAIGLDPNNAELYADRAQANIKLQNLTEAVADANRAIELDSSMARAYFRKGTACIKLEEYETAKAALEIGASLDPANSRFANLIKQCEECIAEEAANLQRPEASEDASKVVPMEDDQQANVPPSEAPIVPPAKPKYRHEFYQKPEEVVVTIFAKGLPANAVTVDFGEQILSVSINVPDEDAYHLQPRLFGKIIPAKCRYNVLSTKIEIRLAKADPIHWTSLEYSTDTAVVRKVTVPSGTVANKPSYPSSKPKGVDWDKLEAEVKKEEKDEKLDGDAALNKFFRDIYKDADEDMRRAMQKSFVESNGTVLSTNWKEVGTKKVEGSPPDGMEMKKWEI